MTTITRFNKEQLIARAREKVKSLEFAVTQTAFADNRAELEEELDLARIALASLEADDNFYSWFCREWEQNYQPNGYSLSAKKHLGAIAESAWFACRGAMLQGKAAGNSPVIPDANGWLPCPFCNSPVKWCGENSADPDDDHICHHIQCTNPECSADFDFINTGDDLLPDDPAVLDAMTSAELVQPLRAVCKGRFNSRAAMLQGSQPVSNRDELPEEKGASLQLRNLIRQRHAEWSDATFGNVGPVGPLKHLSKEALEAAAEPDDLSEWADMQLLLWDAQRRAGISDSEITAAMEEKLKVNMARQWPEPKDGEPRLHIKEQSESVLPEIEYDICGHVSTEPEGRHHCCEDNSND